MGYDYFRQPRSLRPQVAEPGLSPRWVGRPRGFGQTSWKAGVRTLGEPHARSTLQILWGSLRPLQGRWLLKIGSALLQRTLTPLERLTHFIIYSSIQLVLSIYNVPGIQVEARGAAEMKSLPSRVEISMRQSGMCCLGSLRAQWRGPCWPGNWGRLPGEGDI